MAVYVSAFSPFAQITPFRYLDAVVVDCRLWGLYDLVLAGNYAKAAISINDILANLTRVEELDFDWKTYNLIYETFAHLKIDMAMHRYTKVHERLRDLHYTLAQL